MKLIIAIVLSTMICAAAMLNEFSFTGIIKKIKEDQVTVLCQGQKFSIAKSDVINGIIRVGEPIYFKISGDKMQSIFFKTKPSQALKAK